MTNMPNLNELKEAVKFYGNGDNLQKEAKVLLAFAQSVLDGKLVEPMGGQEEIIEDIKLIRATLNALSDTCDATIWRARENLKGTVGKQNIGEENPKSKLSDEELGKLVKEFSPTDHFNMLKIAQIIQDYIIRDSTPYIKINSGLMVEIEMRIAKLFPKLTEEGLGFLIFKAWNKFSDNEARENWTAKHYQSVTKEKSSELAKAILKEVNL